MTTGLLTLLYSASKNACIFICRSHIESVQKFGYQQTNRFGKYDPPNNRYGEVNSGKWYQNAYNNCINDPEKDFLCPIIFSNDKTTLSDIGDLHVDGIFMTTSLLNNKVLYYVL